MSAKPKGMQLNSNKVVKNTLPEGLVEEANGSSNPWGSDDLMDVNADADDWSECFLCS